MTTQDPVEREVLRLEEGWRFHLGDIEHPSVRGHLETYLASKAGSALGAARPDYDDSTWRVVDLPHDWAVELPFDPTENANQGYKPRGIAWYRRRFRLDETDEGKYLALRFDGVVTHCTVWLNGQLLHRNWCGYTSFVVDISTMATYGDRLNTLVVRVDANAFEGWWYEGAGINRHVWLIKASALHVAPWGVWVNSVKQPEGHWQTEVETTLENAGDQTGEVMIRSSVVSPGGDVIAWTESTTQVLAGEQWVVQQTIPIADPQPWSLVQPTVYTLRTEVFQHGVKVDCVSTTFGYRTLRFDPDEGFFLNDQPVKLKGTCNHQDHAGVGVAVPDTLHEYRIRRLKEMGCNAYRCAHHPPAPELLEACDRLGMLVMDENRNFSNTPEVLEQVRQMVIRDRNHPSVILWSIFNEEMLQGCEIGQKLAKPMVRLIKELDSSRPVMAAINTGMLEPSGVAGVLDVMGINYSQHTYDEAHALFPLLPLVSSENNATFSTRGVYQSAQDAMVWSSYDDCHTEFGNIARKAWQEINSRPFIMGSFVWSGFDYRGEPAPYVWPAISAQWGNLDTCGFAKDGFYLHQALWTEEPMVHILPHWNWPDRVGLPVKVMAYTNCDEVELFLNGRSIGKASIDLYEQAAWEVEYEPGVLEAVAYRNGAVAARHRVETTGEPVRLVLEPDRHWLSADGEDAIPVTVSAVDAQGRIVPTAQHFLSFTTSGTGRMIGVGNGNPTCREVDKGTARSLFNGLCQVIIQATAEPGTLVLTATADGLTPSEVTLECRPDIPRPSVPVPSEVRLVRGWRRLPICAERPDPHMELAAHDMNSWEHVEAGYGPDPSFSGRPGYALYRTTVVPPLDYEQHRRLLVFSEIAGTAEIYLDGQLSGRKDEETPGPASVTLHQTWGSPVTATVLIHTSTGVGGLSGLVRIEMPQV